MAPLINVEKPNNDQMKGSDFSDNHRKKPLSPRQLSWFILLKANKALAKLSWLFTSSRQKFTYIFVMFLVVISVLGLMFEFVDMFGSNMSSSFEVWSFVGRVYEVWSLVRVDYVVPCVVLLSRFCIVLFMIQSLDRFVLCLGWFWIKFKKIKPQVVEEDAQEDVENGGGYFPMVLVQIPMCNEREVYEQSIGAICELDWPKDRLLIQVLDDSNDKNLRLLIEEEVSAWREGGVNIVYRHRLARTGYKAGNMKSAMACHYVQDYEFVAIFDADFQPNPDFLKQTIPHFKGNPEVGLVQARWSYVNKDENLLTRLQNINLCFHFEVEQQVNGIFSNFFGFNGTAGVWRIKALEESGGWLDRTTVEDMDIAVRAHLNGWKFIFLNDVQVLCELPECYEAYKKQQHRWHSGPMQLFRMCLPSIIKSKISTWKKANLIFLFFLLRKLILPFYSFTLFCIILPLSMFIPEAELPIWVICYIPIFMSFLNILPALKSFPFLVPYLLFENTMSVTKFSAMVSGLFQLGGAYEWVVTKKTGREDKATFRKLEEEENVKKKRMKRVFRTELALALLLLTAATRSYLSVNGVHFYFLLFQGLSFLIVGLDLVGDQSK